MGLRSFICGFLDCSRALSRVDYWLGRIWREHRVLKRLKEPGDAVGRAEKLYEWLVPPDTLRAGLREYALAEVYEALEREGVDMSRVRWLDGRYYVFREEQFRRALSWDWSDAVRYELDRFDCDDYGLYFKARMAFEFGYNAVAYVVDYASGHAYNIAVIERERGGLEARIYEPQGDTLFPPGYRDALHKLSGDYVVLI